MGENVAADMAKLMLTCCSENRNAEASYPTSPSQRSWETDRLKPGSKSLWNEFVRDWVVHPFRPGCFACSKSYPIGTRRDAQHPLFLAGIRRRRVGSGREPLALDVLAQADGQALDPRAGELRCPAPIVLIAAANSSGTSAAGVIE